MLSKRSLSKVLMMDMTLLITLTTSGQVTTIAGNGKYGFADGHGQDAMFAYPRAICFSKYHNCLFVCDCGNHRIRVIDLKTGITKISNLMSFS